MSLAWKIRVASGAEILPREWEVRRIGDLVTLTNGFPFPSEAFGADGEFPLVRIRDLGGGPFETFVRGEVPPAALLRNGDVVIGMDGDFNLTVWNKGVAALNQRLCLLRPRPGIDIRFLAYFLPPSLKIINDLTFSTTVKHLSSADILSERVVLPPLEEQRRIADFLDAETSRIDRLSMLRRSQLKLIREGLATDSALLSGRAEVNNMNGTADGVVQLRRAISGTQTGSTPTDLRRSTDDSTHNDTPWYTPAAIDGWMSFTQAEKVTRATRGTPNFPSGSVIMTGIGESLGKVGYLSHAATGNQQLTALTPAPGINGRFIAWQLWAAESEIREWAQYSRIRIINNDVLKSFPIFLPPRTEQDSAVHILDSRLARVRQVEAATYTFQGLANERRQALITAAVTGQFDVSTASGRNVTDGV